MSILQLLIDRKDKIIKLKNQEVVKLFPGPGQKNSPEADSCLSIGRKDEDLKNWSLEKVGLFFPSCSSFTRHSPFELPQWGGGGGERN